jgi:4-diphosphocytidyl-2-C-methyl-D-erythritol kinase
MTVYPNVKLNLGLRVLGKRPDGYHELESLFIPWDGFRDELCVEPAAEFGIEIGGPCYRGWDPSEDLTARAWRLLRDEFGIGPVHIRLTKNSPVGAGLGGGSADGAFMVRALNDLFGLSLSDDALAALAARLGSDCPFFIYNRPMFVSGRGDVLEPFDIDLSGYRIEVAVPEGVAVSTREAYVGLDAQVEVLPPRGMPASTLHEVLRLPVPSWRGRLVNDFELSVFPAHPEIAALKERFYADGATYASMSGSGSAVFALFPSK